MAGNETTTDVMSVTNSTLSDVLSTTNATLKDFVSRNVTSAENPNTTFIDDVIFSVDATTISSLITSTSDVMSTLNVTGTSLIATLNDTLTSTLYGDYAYNVTNMSSSPSPLVTSPNSSFNSSMTSETVAAQRVASSINFWVPPFLFSIGSVTNVLVIMVMQSKDFRRMSTSFYMSVSSLFDMFSLVVSLPAHYLYVNFPHIFDNVRDAHPMCAFFNIFGWGSSDMGVLLTVAMTTERSLAIQFPLKAPTLCTVKRAKIVSLCLFFLELLKVGHFIYGTRVSSIEVTAFLCDVDLTSDPTYAIFYTEYWPYIHNVFLLVAFIVIIIGNIIITVHVKRSEDSKDMGEGAKTAGGGKGGKMSSKSRQLSLMLIIDSATIVVCTLPFSLYVVVDQTFNLFEDTPEGRGQSSLIFAIVFYLLYVNRCANFFLYCVSGARFRTTLKNILTKNSLKERRKKAQNYVTGATNTRNMTSVSSGFTSDGEGGDKVSMNPMGPSTVSGKVANEEAKGVSMNPNGRPASTTSLASGGSPGLGGTSKLERHYGYGKA